MRTGSIDSFFSIAKQKIQIKPFYSIIKRLLYINSGLLQRSVRQVTVQLRFRISTLVVQIGGIMVIFVFMP